MPKAGGKSFPYTAKGKAAAKQAEKKADGKKDAKDAKDAKAGEKKLPPWLKKK